MPLSKKRAQLLVVGLDGADYDLIEVFVKQGYLPCFRKILDKGVRGKLKSTLPPSKKVERQFGTSTSDRTLEGSLAGLGKMAKEKRRNHG